MSYVSSQRFYPNMVLSIAATSIGAGYSLVGAIVNASRILAFDNNTDSDLMISFDGFNDHFPVISKTGKVFDLTANKTDINAGWFIATGQQIWVRELGSPTTGE